MSINPRTCHSEPVSDVTGVGIRNLLAGNLWKSAGIMRFRNGLPRQSVPQGHLLRGADWLAMTDFFDNLKRDRREPVSFAVNRQKTDFAKRNVYFDKTDGYGGKVAAKCGEWRERC